MKLKQRELVHVISGICITVFTVDYAKPHKSRPYIYADMNLFITNKLDAK